MCVTSPGTWEYATFNNKRDFPSVIKLRTWDSAITLDYPGGSSVINRVFIRGTEEGQGERVLKLLHYLHYLLNVEGVVVSQRRQDSLGAGKDKKWESPLETSEECSSDFSPIRTILDFWPWNCKIINVCCFKPHDCIATCFSSQRNVGATIIQPHCIYLLFLCVIHLNVSHLHLRKSTFY